MGVKRCRGGVDASVLSLLLCTVAGWCVTGSLGASVSRRSVSEDQDGEVDDLVSPGAQGVDERFGVRGITPEFPDR